MTERDEAWAPGTPCWADLMSSDAEAARAFYGTLFGWNLMVGPPETGGYAMAQVDDRSVSGIGQIERGVQMPTVWTTYLATTDADATAAGIKAAGGGIYLEPFDVMEFGRMGVGSDPSGAVFGFWQSGRHYGFQLANVVNSVTWNECLTRDWAAAKAFYADVFGYTYTDVSGSGFEYATIEVDGNTVGGIGSMPAGAPAQAPSFWSVYFAVTDADETVTAAIGLGATVMHEAMDSPYGRMAALMDPQGAAFSIIASTSEI